MTSKPATPETAIEYARDITTGKRSACELVRLACQRFIDELSDPPTGYTYDERKALRVLRFVQLMKHTKGPMAGQPFHLEPWQAFLICNVFGWIDAEGLRRFTKVLLTVPRKNGKSTVAAAIANYMLIADGEASADVYTAATKLDQARIIFDEAYRMAEDSPFSDHLKYANSQNLKYLRYERSELRPLASQDKTLDGLNPHAVFIDEYHAHRNDDLFNVLLTGMGARTQPLMFTVTTAGFDKNSPALKYQGYCEKVTRGLIEDPNTFALIYTIDDGDDWTAETTWRKANPNYGVSILPKKFKQDLREALEIGHKEVEFKTKYLNIWTDTAAAWIPDRVWMEGDRARPFTEADLTGAKCYAGLDLAATGDFTCFARVFDKDGQLYLLPTFFLPEETIAKRTDQTGDAIRDWVRRGLIEVMPGRTADYRFLTKYIQDAHARHPIECIAFDRFNSSQPVAELTEAGMEMVPFGQGYVMMNAPTRELERLALNGNLRHGANPVMRWQVGNVVLTKDPAGNVKMDKSRSADKIDGPVAAAMAVGLWMDNMMTSGPAEFYAL
jgi:phage terminase large subunit-like protein